MCVHVCSWVFMGVHGCSWVFMGVHGCSCVFMGVHVCSRVFMCVLMGFQFFCETNSPRKNTYIGDIQPSFLISKKNQFQ